MTYHQYCRMHVHVGASNRTVIRAAHRMISAVGKTRAMRDVRHAWLRRILAEHRDAGSLYNAVVTGSL